MGSHWGRKSKSSDGVRLNIKKVYGEPGEWALDRWNDKYPDELHSEYMENNKDLFQLEANE